MKKLWRDVNGLTIQQGLIVHGIIDGDMRKTIADDLHILMTTFDSEMKIIYIESGTSGKVALAFWGKSKGY
jgi:hypothetical protein